jgi:ferredoxin--NADP+ reductase
MTQDTQPATSQLNARISKRVAVTPELVIFHIKPDQAIKSFLPGQYVAIGLPASSARPSDFPPEREPQTGDKLIKRAYSIGSAPTVLEELEFYIAIVPDGALTSRLALLQEGDRIHLAPKITGTFTLQSVPSDANLVLLSTGTGIAPYISMLRTPSTWLPGRQITLVHGVRYASDLAYRTELQALAEQQSCFRYLPVASREKETWNGQRGRLQTLFEGSASTEPAILLDPARDHVFLCGNPAMINEMETLLVKRGYQEHTRKNPGSLHLERYW